MRSGFGLPTRAALVRQSGKWLRDVVKVWIPDDGDGETTEASSGQ
jgi:hypothetical protein